MFARNQYGFSVKQLPMKGKRHPNGYVEHRVKAGQLGRSIYQRYREVSINDIVIFRITNMNLGTLKLIQFKVKLTADR